MPVLIYPLLVLQNAEALAHLREDFIPAIEAASNAHRRRMMNNYSFSFDVNSPPQKFDKPVLFLLGRQDDSVGFRDSWYILDEFPRATIAVLDKAGHLLQIEQPQLYRALVNERLDRIEGYGSLSHQNVFAYQGSAGASRPDKS